MHSLLLGHARGKPSFDLLANPGDKNDLKIIRPDIFVGLKMKYAASEQTVLKPIVL